MTKKSKYIIGAATLIFIASIFLPSRLTSFGLKTILSTGQYGLFEYAPYLLVLFPISFGLALGNKIREGFIVSTALLLINTTLFEDLLYFLFHHPDLTFSSILFKTLPFFIYCAIFLGLIYMVLKHNRWIWYSAFIFLIIISYIWLNDLNCTLKFMGDMGVTTYDISIWFKNCGTYYAWWTAPIILNIGLYNEIRTTAKGKLL